MELRGADPDTVRPMAHTDGTFQDFFNDNRSSGSDDESEAEVVLDLFIALTVERRAFLFMHQSLEPIELSHENQSTVIHDMPANNLLFRHIGHRQQFQDLTNFTPEEYEELCRSVCPIIESNARSTGRGYIVSGRPCKLSPEQRLMSFILYLKHDNTIEFDASRWNWCKAGIYDDALFVATCVNAAIADEIRWPTVEERRVLGQHIPQLPGCIGIVDCTLVKIRRPFENPRHHKWFQGRKKMYCMNSSVVVDHNGLFIYINPGYPGSYHDYTILRNSWIQTEIRAMRLPRGHVSPPMRAFNKMHAGYRVKVEWGIGGLKMEWRRLQKRWDLHKPRFKIIFTFASLLTNFIHRRGRNMAEDVIGPRGHARDRGWAEDF